MELEEGRVPFKHTMYVGLNENFSLDRKTVQETMAKRDRLIASILFDCTVLWGKGFWMGGTENTLIIEYISDHHLDNDEEFNRLAKELGKLYRQNSVLCTSTQLVASELVTIP